MINADAYRCRVCGWLLREPPWGVDGRTPLFDYCPCCGVEFGYQDATPSGARSYRERWMARGAPWNDLTERPSDWSLDAQLGEVPDKFR
jgi:hypothetical protein